MSKTEQAVDWPPGASLDTLKKRARILRGIRAFFDARDVLEVETPALSQAATCDPNIESLAVSLADAATHWLHSSPELAMKRLLAAGSGDIYQICKVFRDGESGQRHNPEFSMLEWYRLGFDLTTLMDEVQTLFVELAAPLRPAIVASIRNAPRFGYFELFQRIVGLDADTASRAAFEACALDHGLSSATSFTRTDYRDLIFAAVVEPKMPEACFVQGFPADQAALARFTLDEQGRRVGDRFEFYLDGMELANGFHELTDAREQTARFEQDNRTRERNGQPRRPLDRRFLAALESGLPACSGVAVGVDRLVMALCGKTRIGEVIAFEHARA